MVLCKFGCLIGTCYLIQWLCDLEKEIFFSIRCNISFMEMKYSVHFSKKKKKKLPETFLWWNMFLLCGFICFLTVSIVAVRI